VVDRQLMSQIGRYDCNIIVLLYASIVIQNILSVHICWCSFDVHRG
jgi:hypothetical protein